MHLSSHKQGQTFRSRNKKIKDTSKLYYYTRLEVTFYKLLYNYLQDITIIKNYKKLQNLFFLNSKIL